MKHVTRKSQHGFTKDKLCLTNLIKFCDRVTCLVDVGQVVDIVSLDFSKALNNSFPQPPPRETDALQSRQVVCAVGGELADRLHLEGNGK